MPLNSFLAIDEVDLLTQRLYKQGWLKSFHVTPVIANFNKITTRLNQVRGGKSFKAIPIDQFQEVTHIDYSQPSQQNFIPFWASNHFVLLEDINGAITFIDSKGGYNEKSKALTQVPQKDIDILVKAEFWLETNGAQFTDTSDVQNAFLEKFPNNDLETIQLDISNARWMLQLDCQSRKQIWDDISSQFLSVPQIYGHEFQIDSWSCGYQILLYMVLKANNYPPLTKPLDPKELQAWVTQCDLLLIDRNHKIQLPQSIASKPLPIAPLDPSQQQPAKSSDTGKYSVQSPPETAPASPSDSSNQKKEPQKPSILAITSPSSLTKTTTQLSAKNTQNNSSGTWPSFFRLACCCCSPREPDPETQSLLHK